MSLRARLTLGTALALAVAITVGLFAAYFVVRGQLRGEIDRSLSAFATPRVRRDTHVPDRRQHLGALRLPRTRTPATLGGAVGYFQSVGADGKTSLPPDETVHLPDRPGPGCRSRNQRPPISATRP